MSDQIIRAARILYEAGRYAKSAEFLRNSFPSMVERSEVLAIIMKYEGYVPSDPESDFSKFLATTDAYNELIHIMEMFICCRLLGREKAIYEVGKFIVKANKLNFLEPYLKQFGEHPAQMLNVILTQYLTLRCKFDDFQAVPIVGQQRIAGNFALAPAHMVIDVPGVEADGQAEHKPLLSTEEEIHDHPEISNVDNPSINDDDDSIKDSAAEQEPLLPPEEDLPALGDVADEEIQSGKCFLIV